MCDFRQSHSVRNVNIPRLARHDNGRQVMSNSGKTDLIHKRQAKKLTDVFGRRALTIIKFEEPSCRVWAYTLTSSVPFGTRIIFVHIMLKVNFHVPIQNADWVI